MLPKKKRITKATFQSLMKEKRLFSNEFFLFYSKKNDFSQYAFVAPKSIFKQAVKRNKYRRIGYNVLRSVPIKHGLGIFVYKKQVILATKEQIKDSIISILKKTKFLE